MVKGMKQAKLGTWKWIPFERRVFLDIIFFRFHIKRKGCMVRSFSLDQGPLVMQMSPHHPAIWTRKHHGSGTNPMCLKLCWKFVDFDMTNMIQSLKCESGNCTIQCIITPPWHKGSLLSNTTIWDIRSRFLPAAIWPGILLPGDTATWWKRGSSLTKAFGNCRTGSG